MHVRSVTLGILLVVSACRREAPSRPTPPPPSAAATTDRPGAARGAPPATAAEPSAPASAFRETARFLPQGASVPGWVQSGDVRLANGQELFQLIDGAGEKYVQYGFRQLGRTDYRKAGTELVVTAEVYDMGSPLGAFGQYSMLLSEGRDPASMESQAVSHGGGGFLGTSQLVFWKGQHLVQINIADDSGERDEAAMAAAAREALPAFATRIAAALPGDTTPPAPPAALPREGLVWGGVVYLTNNVLNLPDTGPGWVGHYRGEGSQRWRVAVLNREQPAQATALVARLREGPSEPIAGLGNEAASVDGAAGQLIVARQGTPVVVVASDMSAGAELPPRDRRVALARAALAAH